MARPALTRRAAGRVTVKRLAPRIRSGRRVRMDTIRASNPQLALVVLLRADQQDRDVSDRSKNKRRYGVRALSETRAVS